MPHLLIIGGSDAGMSAAAGARSQSGVRGHRPGGRPLPQLQHLHLDLSYTPPLSTPWDAVQVAAQAWMKKRAEG